MKTKIYLWRCAILLLFVMSANAQNASENEDIQKIQELKLELIQANQAALEQKLQINNLKSQSATARTEISALRNGQDILSIYGFNVGKSLYEISFPILLGLLFVSSLVFVFKFRNANVLTAKATETLANLEMEFEEHVRNSLERDQKLRRQLQDELNRHKISQAS